MYMYVTIIYSVQKIFPDRWIENHLGGFYRLVSNIILAVKAVWGRIHQ